MIDSQSYLFSSFIFKYIYIIYTQPKYATYLHQKSAILALNMELFDALVLMLRTKFVPNIRKLVQIWCCKGSGTKMRI